MKKNLTDSPAGYKMVARATVAFATIAFAIFILQKGDFLCP
jgi:hypothetical protein